MKTYLKSLATTRTGGAAMEFGDREWKREKEEWKRRDRGRENQTDSQRRKRGIRITDALQIYMRNYDGMHGTSRSFTWNSRMDNLIKLRQ
ncbi:hypothetical protein MANES_03G161850v8 [Manihot esculenta]|uniref:Uncharacterized protein n=1 Tax=Manihot esculenta TaxID=3983 RepID=A0ACB7I0G7_MANES|nr:hypothetical protein MANES_03G161850v8 [Manihot esculenta]